MHSAHISSWCTTVGWWIPWCDFNCRPRARSEGDMGHPFLPNPSHCKLHSLRCTLQTGGFAHQHCFFFTIYHALCTQHIANWTIYTTSCSLQAGHCTLNLSAGHILYFLFTQFLEICLDIWPSNNLSSLLLSCYHVPPPPIPTVPTDSRTQWWQADGERHSS